MISFKKAVMLNGKNQVLTLSAEKDENLSGEFDIYFNVSAKDENGNVIYTTLAVLNDDYESARLEGSEDWIADILEEDDECDEIIEMIDVEVKCKIESKLADLNDYRAKAHKRDTVIFLFGHVAADDNYYRAVDMPLAKSQFKEVYENRGADKIVNEHTPTYADALRSFFNDDKADMSRKMNISERTLYRKLDDHIADWDLNALAYIYSTMN